MLSSPLEVTAPIICGTDLGCPVNQIYTSSYQNTVSFGISISVEESAGIIIEDTSVTATISAGYSYSWTSGTSQEYGCIFDNNYIGQILLISAQISCPVYKGMATTMCYLNNFPQEICNSQYAWLISENMGESGNLMSNIWGNWFNVIQQSSSVVVQTVTTNNIPLETYGCVENPIG